jgi:DNA-binding response OmpR family regulator
MSATVLIAEQDDVACQSLCIELDRIGYRTIVAKSGADALHLAQVQLPSLLVLDTALSDMNGLDVCRSIRKRSATPILILSSDAEEADRVLGFELGADDYVTKPFSTREVGCRIRAILRRVWATPETTLAADETIRLGRVVINPGKAEVTRNGKAIRLQPGEYKLLWLLARNPGHVFTRDQLNSVLWDPSYPASRNAVRVRIWNLRDRIEEDPSHPRYLRTSAAGGYFFDP